MAANIFVPTISTPHVTLGMIDSTNPSASVDNRPFSQLVNAGVMVVDPGEMAAVKQGGDRITIPSLDEPADFGRVDITSDAAMIAQEHNTRTDVGVVQWNRQLYKFSEKDAIRSGMNASAEYSLKIGGKKAKRLFNMAMCVATGAIEAADTPTANCHVSDIYSATTPAYPTVERMRALKALLGDAQERLTTCVIHSVALGHLIKDLIANYGMSTIANESMQRGLFASLLGITNWVVTDLMPMADSGLSYQTMLFGPGAIWVSHQRDLSVDVQRVVTGTTTIDYMAMAFNAVAHLRFVKWNDAANNPTDVNLADPTKWDEAYDDHRRVLAAKMISN